MLDRWFRTLRYAEYGLLYKYKYSCLSTGGTDEARYCYSVWMRHFINYYNTKKDIPHTIVEFGPGDTMGIGMTGLLCGAKEYFALDFARYDGIEKNDNIFNQLLNMVKNRCPIPDDEEFPNIFPKLESYEFPSWILTEEVLTECLSKPRIDAIRMAIKEIKRGRESDIIHYLAPWNGIDTKKIEADFVYSQAVFEHIDEYVDAHKIIGNMLKKGAVVSHQIDFSCHGCADKWNGHYAYGRFVWKLVYGSRPYFLNRMPLKIHLIAMRNSNIRILKCVRTLRKDGINKNEVCRQFCWISEKDLKTVNAYILGIKK